MLLDHETKKRFDYEDGVVQHLSEKLFHGCSVITQNFRFGKIKTNTP